MRNGIIMPGSAQWLFMAEAEGCDNLVNTRTARLNAIVNEINSKYSNAVIDSWKVEAIAERHGLSQLTAADWEYIQSRI